MTSSLEAQKMTSSLEAQKMTSSLEAPKGTEYHQQNCAHAIHHFYVDTHT